MHSSDRPVDVLLRVRRRATESLTIEGAAGERLWELLARAATIRRRTADGPLAGGMTTLG